MCPLYMYYVPCMSRARLFTFIAVDTSVGLFYNALLLSVRA